MDWWAHVLGWSAAGSAVAAAVLLAVLAYAPYGFLHDFPDDIREAAAPPTPAQRRAGIVGGAVFMLTLLAALATPPITWGLAHPDTSWWSLSAMAVVGLAVFALVDLVIIDWLVICSLRPRVLLLTGTGHCAGWSDYGFHLRETLRPRALALFPLFGAVIGTASWLLTSWLAT